MSFSNPDFQFKRERRFPTSSPAPAASSSSASSSASAPLSASASFDAVSSGTKNEPLIINGQGVIIFKTKDISQPGISTTISFYNQDKNLDISVKLEIGKITLIQNDKVLSESAAGLVAHNRAFYWISLDAQKQCLRFGVGEARLETQTFDYQFAKTADTKVWMRTLSSLSYDDQRVIPIRLLRDPILSNVPLTVKNTNELTMDMVGESSVMPRANLPSIGQKLYDNVAGEKFTLETDDFPDFAAAVEHSIATPGCWCYQKIKEKVGSGDPNKVYLRITMGQNGGESPGIPYVMEIWPPGSYSSIHNHAGANAVIRGLYGEIDVDLFPYLGTEKSYATANFKKGDVTWISPTLNQFHRLKNPNKNGPTCITIQCYMYDETDTGHYDYFDYIADDDEIKQYDPGSDMDFVAFKKLMKEEWAKK